MMAKALAIWTDAGDADRPFLTSAPYSDLNPSDEKTGRVIIQIELDAQSGFP